MLLSHEKPSPLMSLFFMFFITIHHLHYQHKTTRVSPFFSQPIPHTALHIYKHFVSANYHTPQLQILITNLNYGLQTKQPSVNAPAPTHDSLETLAKQRNLCTILQEPKLARFVDAMSVPLEHSHGLQENNYVLQQKRTINLEFFHRTTTAKN